MFGLIQHEVPIGVLRRDVKETVGSLSLEDKEDVSYKGTHLGLSILETVSDTFRQDTITPITMCTCYNICKVKGKKSSVTPLPLHLSPCFSNLLYTKP